MNGILLFLPSTKDKQEFGTASSLLPPPRFQATVKGSFACSKMGNTVSVQGSARRDAMPREGAVAEGRGHGFTV